MPVAHFFWPSEHFLSLSSVCLGMLDVEASGYLFHRIRFPDPETGEMPFCLNIPILIVERILMKVRLILVNKFLVYFKGRLLVIK